MDVIGTTLGSYRIIELIGQGGMGQIYRAEHERLGRQVALKILKPELAYRSDIARRFLEEARAVNDIRHPKIVDIYDFIEDDRRQPPLVCMVMELLRGESLASCIARRGPLPLSEVIHIARQICEALEAVHGAMILHRDLKAENIFLLAGDGPKQIKLLDFGSIKSLDEERQLNLTDPGTALGTPEYMAPEQVLGEKLDVRTDVYAMGVVLYKMLSGTVPFSGPSYGALMVNVLKNAPPAIAGQSLATRSSVPRAMESVVMRCLQKKARRRFQSMDELSAALKTSLQSVRANSAPSAMLASKPAATKGAADALTMETVPRRLGPRRIGIVLLTVVVGVALAAWLLPERGKPDKARTRSAQSTSTSTPSTDVPTKPAAQAAMPATTEPRATEPGGAIAAGDTQTRNPSDSPATPDATPAKTRAERAPHAAHGLPRRAKRPAAQRNRPSGGTVTPAEGKTDRPSPRQPARAESTTVDPFSM